MTLLICNLSIHDNPACAHDFPYCNICASLPIPQEDQICTLPSVLLCSFCCAWWSQHSEHNAFRGVIISQGEEEEMGGLIAAAARAKFGRSRSFVAG